MPTARGIQRIVKQYVKKLGQSITINKAILTGSWATGTQREDSDVDLIIISDDFSKMPFSVRLSYLHKKWTNKVPFGSFWLYERRVSADETKKHLCERRHQQWTRPRRERLLAYWKKIWKRLRSRSLQKAWMK